MQQKSIGIGQSKWLNGPFACVILVIIFFVLIVISSVLPCSYSRDLSGISGVLVVIVTLLYPAVASILIVVTKIINDGWSGLLHGLGWAFLFAAITATAWFMFIYFMLEVKGCGLGMSFI